MSKAFWSGWILFAAIMMMMIGAFNVIQGLAAIFSDDYYAVSDGGLLVFDFTTWGIVTLIWGVLLVLIGIALASGEQWARWVGVVIVGLNAVAQIAFLSAFPLWSILIIALNVLVLYALAARWDDAQEDMAGTV